MCVDGSLLLVFKYVPAVRQEIGVPVFIGFKLCVVILKAILLVQGGSNMTGTDLCVNKCKQSRSYLNHLVYNKCIRVDFK